MNAHCAELVARCFAARTAMHIAHLKARTYAEHKVLEKFYSDIAETADAFIECYMGVDGRINEFPSIAPDLKTPPLEYLPQLHEWIEKHRTLCADGSTELANLIDEILSTIDRAFYKLKFLK